MNNNNFFNRILVVLILRKWIVVSIIIFIALFKSCFAEQPDPMDNSINKSREIIKHLEVVDSTNNGFRTVFATRHQVTHERAEEISSRSHVQELYNEIRRKAPQQFGNLLYTDIYDFADHLLQYNIDPDIVIHNIFVHGSKKCNLYVQFNPDIENCATWFDYNTEQGALYLSCDDIYFRISNKKIYRYWKCFGNNATSLADEQFSHFSETQRVR